MSLAIVPVTIGAARAYVTEHHRHHDAPVSGLFALACADGDRVCGVAIVGRPVARMLADGWTAEVTRLATDGTRNACSMLYGAAWRAARALGWRRLVTYTLPAEGGGIAARGGVAAHRRGGGRVVEPDRPPARGPSPDAREVPMGGSSVIARWRCRCGAVVAAPGRVWTLANGSPRLDVQCPGCGSWVGFLLSEKKPRARRSRTPRTLDLFRGVTLAATGDSDAGDRK